jgi:uncharacterized membrane protein YczE
MVRLRLVQLYAGLVLYGISMGLMIRAGLGLDPWDVFHQGLADHTGWSFGVTTRWWAPPSCCSGSRCGSGPGSAR